MDAVCRICPLECRLPEGESGSCRVRTNVGGRVSLQTYGMVSTAICGPIEQKPLFHFFPGMRTLSLGGAGCNMSCGYCQNFQISQVATAGSRDMPPDDAVAMAKRLGAEALAFTYSEPIVWFEYVADVARAARRAGLKTVLKTNGFANEGPFAELCSLMDAVNVDVKGGRKFYSEVCRLPLDGEPSEWPMVRNLPLAAGASHLEVSVMVVPGYETDGVLGAVSDAVGPSVPVHLLSFVPDFRMRDVPPPTKEQLATAAESAKEKFDFVYVQYAGLDLPTVCPSCGTEAVARRGLEVVRKSYGKDGECSACGRGLGIKDSANARTYLAS